MTNGMIDLMIMVIILAVVIAVSMTLIMPLMHETYEDYTYVLSDKTVSNIKGENVVPYGDYDGNLSKLEAILVTQIIDNGMPEPKRLSTGGSVIDVDINYRLRLYEYAQVVWNEIRDDPASSRYNYEFDFKTPETIEDDAYEIELK